MSLDDKDIQIIKHLKKDGRASLRNIAEELDLSPSTVSNRFHRLKQERVIKDFKPVLDHEKIGFNLTAVIDVRVESEMKDRVFPSLENLDNVVSAFVVTGDTDMVIVCKFVDRENMYGFLKELQRQEGVSETETKVALDSRSEDSGLNLDQI